MATSPNIYNYSIPRGTVTFTPTGGSLTSLGNCTQFRYTADVTKLDHFSSMAGIRTKDRSVVTQLGATVAMILDEINEYNMSLFILAEGTTSTMLGLSKTDLTGQLDFTGTNDIGAQVQFSGLVQFQPGGNLDLIVENAWQTIPLNAEVLASGGGYGEWTVGDPTTA